MKRPAGRPRNRQIASLMDKFGCSRTTAYRLAAFPFDGVDSGKNNTMVPELWPLIARQLKGRPPDLQGLALANLTAIWLAGGYRVIDNPAATKKLREDVLRDYVKAIRHLISAGDLEVELFKETLQCSVDKGGVSTYRR